MKTCVKLAHVVAFLLLASYFKPLDARNLEVNVSDGLTEVIQLPVAKENGVEAIRVSAGYCGETKERWPELVGKNGEEAKKIIEKENPQVKAIVLLIGTPVPRDFRCDRVRVYVDPIFNIVIAVPHVG